MMKYVQKTLNPLLGSNHKNRLIGEIKMCFKRKKSPFLMTFLCAPLTDERCNYNAMIEYVTIRKLKG